MAGSKRTNVQGHTILAHPDLTRALKRLPSDLLGRLFREAQEHGQSHVSLEGRPFVLLRHPDHTFTLERTTDEHRTVL